MLLALGSALLVAVSAQSFSTNYTAAGESTYMIDGFEPEAEGKYPVMLMLGTTPIPHAVNVQFLAASAGWSEIAPEGIAGLSETCGFLWVLVEFPRQLQGYEAEEDPCAFQEARARAVFSSPGNALSEICSRPKADCSNGVGVFGLTNGAMVAAVGAGLPDLAYPIAALASSQTGVEGTYQGVSTRLECLTSTALEENLPKNKRRSVISSTDGRFGSTPEEVIAGQKEYSGYDCANDYECLQEDGSGYVVFDSSTIGKAVPHGTWGIWTARGQSSYTFGNLFKWLLTAISSEPPSATCQPGCVPQYELPMAQMAARRRLLFSSMPAEGEMCPAPGMPDFGSFLVNDWLGFAEATAGALLAGPGA
jgi:hypothetical protein